MKGFDFFRTCPIVAALSKLRGAKLSPFSDRKRAACLASTVRIDVAAFSTALCLIRAP